MKTIYCILLVNFVLGINLLNANNTSINIRIEGLEEGTLSFKSFDKFSFINQIDELFRFDCSQSKSFGSLIFIENLTSIEVYLDNIFVTWFFISPNDTLSIDLIFEKKELVSADYRSSHLVYYRYLIDFYKTRADSLFDSFQLEKKLEKSYEFLEEWKRNKEKKMYDFINELGNKINSNGKDYINIIKSETDLFCCFQKLVKFKFIEKLDSSKREILKKNIEITKQKLKDYSKYNYSSAYRVCISNILYFTHILNKDPISKMKTVADLKRIADETVNHFSGVALDIAIAQIFTDYITDVMVNNSDTTALKAMIENYQKTATEIRYFTNLKELLKMKSGIFEQMSLPDINLKDSSGNDINLRSFKGKYYFVDFWATWCGPCLQELKYMEKLHDKFSESDSLEFIYIALEDNFNKWKDYISKRKLKGIHLFNGGGFDSKLTQQLLIKAIPQYYIIKPDGAILTQYAPRPSSNNFIESIRQLIGKK